MNDTFFLFKITGVVQGVGFRPFVYREAKKQNLKGYVKNTEYGVEILTNNKEAIEKILENLPPLARIDSISNKQLPVSNTKYNDFEIHFSDSKTSGENAHIPPDTCICEECVCELFDKKNRRHRYFFITCTNCGPRFSIAKNVPFDRENTAFGDFPLCAECESEYTNPEDRRFHAQTIACEKCGPKLSFFEEGKEKNVDPLLHTIHLLEQGNIVSIKGIGGFFLTCLASSKNVEVLRTLLHRPKKPFAVLMKDLAMAEEYCEITEEEKGQLLSPARPIVLCKKVTKLQSDPAEPLSLGTGKVTKFGNISSNSRLGIMLPYTAIHYLLFEKIDAPLIVTSANMPGIPISTKRQQQNWKYILDYNREITNFADDSLVKVIDEQPLLIRRSRGFVPQAISIPESFQNFSGDILAVGAEIKNMFCVKKGNKLFLSQHLGNTEKLENFENFERTLKKFLQNTSAKPQVILCDMNPVFQVSQFAKRYAKENNIPCIPVQHHKAHVSSVALEHNLNEYIGIAADGTGWGEDRKVWGGEVFLMGHQKKELRIKNEELRNRGNKLLRNENLQKTQLRSFRLDRNPSNSCQRIGHLEYQKLVGGDIANKEPVRFLVGILGKFMGEEEIKRILDRYPRQNISVYHQQAQQNFNCIETSSCGRILDAAAILLGFGDKNYYEGYLAEILESSAKSLPFLQKGELEGIYLEPIIEEHNGMHILKTTELFEFLVKNLETIPKEILAAFVPLYLAKGLHQIAVETFCQNVSTNNPPIVFSGGCAYSTIMTKFLLSKGVKINKDIPAGDGGISAGQIAFQLAINNEQ